MGSLATNCDNSRYHGVCFGASNNNDARIYSTDVFHGDNVLVEEWEITMPPLIVTKRRRGTFAYSRLRKGCAYFMSYSGGPDVTWKHMYRTPSQYPDGERVEIDRMLMRESNA